ncbi:MAG: hypothetical protein MJZ51_05235 [Bacteroidales bacterium]|nr:hypothetical protein [Bacteroidales bacterium]
MNALIRNLRIVLVLSLIGSGYMMLSTFICSIDGLLEKMRGPLIEAYPEMKVSYEIMMATPRICYILESLLYALSIIGVILMFRLKRSGWHCYTLAQLLLLLVPVLFIGRTAFGIGDFMMTILFSTFYFTTLKNIERARTIAETNSPQDSDTKETQE